MSVSGRFVEQPALSTVSEDFNPMSNAQPTVAPAALGGVASQESATGSNFVDTHAVSHARQWRAGSRNVDNHSTGKFIDGPRGSAVTVSAKTNVRFGDPTGGKALTFEVVRPSDSPEKYDQDQPIDEQLMDQADDSDADLDPAMVRAGAAAAARRRELDISQRSLAADGIINAGALIAFEKGRSWPRERTRAKLEEVLQWPAGTIARIRDDETVTTQSSPRIPIRRAPAPAPVVGTPVETAPASDGPASLIAQAVTAAVDTCTLAIAALPSPEDPEFTERAAPILSDLRQLEGIAVQATRISRITPELIKAMSSVRRYHDQLMTLGATAPGATLAQRLYAARRRANLSTLETAQAAGLAEEMIVRAEAEEILPAEIAEAIEALISQIN